jgi:hypothetical protein
MALYCAQFAHKHLKCTAGPVYAETGVTYAARVGCASRKGAEFQVQHPDAEGGLGFGPCGETIRDEFGGQRRKCVPVKIIGE